MFCISVASDTQKLLLIFNCVIEKPEVPNISILMIIH